MPYPGKYPFQHRQIYLKMEVVIWENEGWGGVFREVYSALSIQKCWIFFKFHVIPTFMLVNLSKRALVLRSVDFLKSDLLKLLLMNTARLFKSDFIFFPFLEVLGFYSQDLFFCLFEISLRVFLYVFSSLISYVQQQLKGIRLIAFFIWNLDYWSKSLRF